MPIQIPGWLVENIEEVEEYIQYWSTAGHKSFVVEVVEEPSGLLYRVDVMYTANVKEGDDE